MLRKAHVMQIVSNAIGLVFWCGIPTAIIAGYMYMQEQVIVWPLAAAIGVPAGLLALWFTVKGGGY